MAEQGGVSQEPGTPEGVPIGRAPEIVGPPPIPETPEKSKPEQPVAEEQRETVVQPEKPAVASSGGPAIQGEPERVSAEDLDRGPDAKVVQKAQDELRLIQKDPKRASTLFELVSGLFEDDYPKKQ